MKLLASIHLQQHISATNYLCACVCACMHAHAPMYLCRHVCVYVKHLPVTILELITGLIASPKSEVNAKYRNALANPEV